MNDLIFLLTRKLSTADCACSLHKTKCQSNLVHKLVVEYLKSFSCRSQVDHRNFKRNVSQEIPPVYNINNLRCIPITPARKFNQMKMLKERGKHVASVLRVEIKTCHEIR
ncbi:CLUMA_CG013087, isoform A [Clunio marinus]|uniref:CLUMA_CG013087, isoform A n=1 Tax=Clunio marinus TaxID=568069 RepID=A0A1J1IHM0_9DIPT|nr:CLUMA_CG013087, isoform A [Clunio marinus]